MAKTKTTNKIGRPTKYKATYCKKVDKYIDKCLNPEEGDKKRLPTRAGVAILLNVSLVTIETWSKTHSEFLCALGKVATNQREELINRSFDGSGNSNIGKMLLSANHGLHEKKETEHSGNVNVIINN